VGILFDTDDADDTNITDETDVLYRL